MNETIVRNWNERVKDDDTVIMIGDFCFHNSLGGKEGQLENAHYWDSRLKGNKVYIKGNHDKNNSLNTHVKNVVMEYKDFTFFCTHRPTDADLHFDINLVGHIHNQWLYKKIDNKLLINVGVDVWDFRPVSLRELQKLISTIRRKG
jgi:calcineurin-like phosphoesterase family protein